MHTLTRQERINKRRGKMGTGWQKTKRNTKTSPHIFSKERWVVTVPLNKLPRAYFSEDKAMRVANALALRLNSNVEVDHQIMNNQGEWVEAPE